jgi:hypothetical protein
LVSFETYPAQPKEKTINTPTAKIKLTIFFTRLHLLSLDRCFAYVIKQKNKSKLQQGHKVLGRSQPGSNHQQSSFKTKLTKLVFLVKGKI